MSVTTGVIDDARMMAMASPSTTLSAPVPTTPAKFAAVAYSLTLDKTSVISDKARLEGAITIGANTIIHPRARILARHAPITIGQNCIVEENVIIETIGAEVVNIGNWNWVQSGSVVQASIGHANILRTHCVVGQHTSLGRGNEVLPKSAVDASTGAVTDGSIVSSTLNVALMNGSMRVPLKDRERRHMEQIKLLLDLHAPMIAKAGTLRG